VAPVRKLAAATLGLITIERLWAITVLIGTFAFLIPTPFARMTSAGIWRLGARLPPQTRIGLLTSMRMHESVLAS
jgi:hypothetical protein